MGLLPASAAAIAAAVILLPVSTAAAAEAAAGGGMCQLPVSADVVVAGSLLPVSAAVAAEDFRCPDGTAFNPGAFSTLGTQGRGCQRLEDSSPASETAPPISLSPSTPDPLCALAWII